MITRHLVKTRFGQIHCREAGQGPAIVLLHINQQSSALKIELLESLAPSFRAIAMDYPSYGMSDHIDFQPTIADYADCVEEVLDGLGVGACAALGEATGAAVTMELGGRTSDRFPAIVLLNCPIYKDRTQARDVHAPLKAALRPADATGFPVTRTLEFMIAEDPSHSPLHPNQSWMDRINRAQMECGRDRWQAIDALGAYDIGEAMKRIRASTLLLMGEHFHYTPRLDEYRRLIPGLTAAEIVADARFGMAWEKARTIALRVEIFLRPFRDRLQSGTAA